MVEGGVSSADKQGKQGEAGVRRPQRRPAGLRCGLVYAATPDCRCQDTHLLYCCWGVGGWAGRHCGAGLKGWRCGAAAMGGLAVPLLDSNWIGITLSPGCMGGGDGCT